VGLKSKLLAKVKWYSKEKFEQLFLSYPSKLKLLEIISLSKWGCMTQNGSTLVPYEFFDALYGGI
jgi:hypothetical protein